MNRLSPIRIMLVEDSPDDIAMVQRALRQSTVAHELEVLRDGQEALDRLFPDVGDESHALMPDLILLDLNLPRVTGFELLRKVRAAPQFQAMPVVILSSSSSEEDVLKGYRLGANTYMQKRANLARQIEVLGEYWSVFAKLPPVA